MKLAGRFECEVPEGYKKHKRRILYVGKATAGTFIDIDIKGLYAKKNSAFWDFARTVSRLAEPDCNDLSNLAWSNIFKQGVTIGNPAGQIAEAQRNQAERLLREEVHNLKPSLLVLVNADYYEDIPKAAYLIGHDEHSGLTRTPVKGEKKYDLWSRPAFGEFPPLVWMYHPQIKRREYLAAAIELIQHMTGWTGQR